MPVSHGNTWDSNPDTFVPDQHGRSGDGGRVVRTTGRNLARLPQEAQTFA